MEKFSTWRDPATGLAPFVYPLQPLSMSIQVPRLAWIPFIPLAFCRTCLLFIWAILFSIVDRTFALIFFFFSISFYSVLQSYYTTGFARVALYLLGLTQLPSDPPFSHRTSSQKLIQTKLEPGDLIACNWSSFIEILYLAYLYNPIFILPIPREGKKASGLNETIAKGFEIKTALQLICSSGYPPNQNPTGSVKSLAQCIQESKRLMRVLVVFPEGTTSNNRALLKCFKLNKQSIGHFNDGTKIKIFCLAIKHESPTSFKNSITVPIPSEPLNLPNILRVNLTPVLVPFIFSPRSITIRYPRKDFVEFNFSSLSFNDNNDEKIIRFFDEAFESLSTITKLKLTSQIDGLDKYDFLNYLKLRKS